MKILVACEESQAVTKELRKRGHEAFSCDLYECSGGHPEWHIKGDVLEQLDKKWDMIIAFPPCTHLAVSGARWFPEKRNDGRQKEAIQFFLEIAKADCPRIAIENPIGIMSGKYITEHYPELIPELNKVGLPRKAEQIIQPFHFGHEARKATCLWLKGLPLLKPTNVVGEGEWITYKSGKRMQAWYAKQWGMSQEERSKLRSKTFLGVAKAMAQQWTV